jgi:hypothetical protein
MEMEQALEEHFTAMESSEEMAAVHERLMVRFEGKHVDLRFSKTDIVNLIRGVVSAFSSNFHWVQCAGDASRIYTNIVNLYHAVHGLRIGNWKQDVKIAKSALGSAKGALSAVKSAIDDCNLKDISGRIGKAVGKLSSWIGEIETAAKVATHIVTFVDDCIEVVEGIEHHDWFKVGHGVGGLIKLLS